MLATVLLAGAACETRSSAPRPRVDSTNTRAKDLARLLQEQEQIGQFAQAVEAAGLDSQLSRVGPFTVFAPTDEAFARSGIRLDTLMMPAARDSLRKVVSYYLARGSWTVQRVRDSLRVNTMLDVPIRIERVEGTEALRVDRRPVLTTIPAQNGVLHILGGVLYLPQPDTTEALADTTTAPDA